MPVCEILDTFLSAWTEARRAAADAQIEGWLDRYMSLYLELLQKQLDDYVSQNEDWRAIASERIFPALQERLVFA